MWGFFKKIRMGIKKLSYNLRNYLMKGNILDIVIFYFREYVNK